QIVFVDDELLRSIQFRHGIGNLEIEQLRRSSEPLRMLARFENTAIIGALPFEDAGGIMKTMRENMQLGVLPGDKVAVHPDEAVALVEGQNGHRSLLRLGLVRFKSRRLGLVA